jgi:hypothetical protein
VNSVMLSEKHSLRMLRKAPVNQRELVFAYYAINSTEGKRMHDANALREQARRCRALSKTAIEPEVREQLRVWAVELTEEAEETEWRLAEREKAIVSV